MEFYRVILDEADKIKTMSAKSSFPGKGKISLSNISSSFNSMCCTKFEMQMGTLRNPNT